MTKPAAALRSGVIRDSTSSARSAHTAHLRPNGPKKSDVPTTYLVLFLWSLGFFGGF
jgi:hypothetical protein